MTVTVFVVGFKRFQSKLTPALESSIPASTRACTAQIIGCNRRLCGAATRNTSDGPSSIILSNLLYQIGAACNLPGIRAVILAERVSDSCCILAERVQYKQRKPRF